MTELATKPLDCGLGIEVLDVQAADVLDQGVLDAFVGLFNQHGLVKANVAGFEESHQRALATAIGEITDRAGAPGKSATPGMQYVSNVRKDGVLGKGAINFHHDHLFYNPPLKAIMLYGMEIPKSGSETQFRSSVAFYESLPKALRQQVDHIQCRHLYDHAKLAARAYRDWDTDPTPGSPTDLKPWVWQDPATGKRALLHSQSTLDFVGIERQAGIALYKELTAFGERHAEEILTYRHQWRQDDLVVWHNLLVAHARLPFAKEEPRTLRRTPII